MTTLILDITDRVGLTDMPEEIRSSLFYALRVKVKKTEDIDYLEYQLDQAVKCIPLEKIVVLKEKYSRYDKEILNILNRKTKDLKVNLSILNI